MALRNQPYIPLYVQDFMTDEKLRECSSCSIGVYIFIMCLMHKSEEYGIILLKQKDKQSDDQIENFACKLAKHLPYDLVTIKLGIKELVEEDVLQTDGDKLIQKRMVKDNEISEKRSVSGKKGGENSLGKKVIKDNKKDKIALKFAQAKTQANSENEIEIENEVVIDNNLLFGKYENIFEPNKKLEAQWLLWKAYKKKEHKFGYKSDISEKAALTELFKLSEGNVLKAIEIISQSISNGWKGFFQIDTKTTSTKTNSTSAMSDLMKKHRIET